MKFADIIVTGLTEMRLEETTLMAEITETEQQLFGVTQPGQFIDTETLLTPLHIIIIVGDLGLLGLLRQSIKQIIERFKLKLYTATKIWKTKPPITIGAGVTGPNGHSRKQFPPKKRKLRPGRFIEATKERRFPSTTTMTGLNGASGVSIKQRKRIIVKLRRERCTVLRIKRKGENTDRNIGIKKTFSSPRGTARPSAGVSETTKRRSCFHSSGVPFYSLITYSNRSSLVAPIARRASALRR